MKQNENFKPTSATYSDHQFPEVVKIKPTQATFKTNITPIKDPHDYIKYGVCPICNKHFHRSYSHKEVFGDSQKVLYLADLVYHYRENHDKSWMRNLERNLGNYRNLWAIADGAKQRANERAKQVIIRKTKSLLIALGITSQTFKSFPQSTERTIELAKRKLDVKVCTELYIVENHASEPIVDTHADAA